MADFHQEPSSAEEYPNRSYGTSSNRDDPMLHSIEPMVELGASYRQAGLHRTGSVHRGTTATHSPSSSASIPSKFETIFHRNAKAHSGFSVQTERFRTIKSDVPGPGAYHHDYSPIFTSASLSKKGFGSGFVSMTGRIRWTGGDQYAPCPGPASYDVDSSVSIMADNRRRQFNRAGNVLFRADRPFNINGSHNDQEPRPGPGQYNISGSLLRTDPYPRHGTSSFLSQHDRFARPAVDIPAVPDLTTPIETAVSMPPTAPVRESSMFKGSVIEDDKSVNRIQLMQSSIATPGPAQYTIGAPFGADLYKRGSILNSAMFSSDTRSATKRRTASQVPAIAPQVSHQHEPIVAARSSHPRLIQSMRAINAGIGTETPAFRQPMYPERYSAINDGGPGPGQYEEPISSVRKKSFRSRFAHGWSGN